ncbi:MAG: hypothetical protein ABF479_00455 [Gluconacetobacter sp.]
MPHPLLALAEAYDRVVPSTPGSTSFSAMMAGWLANDAPGEALVGYAARYSVLTQTCQLGRHGILEEPQTDALYGLLASSFWHAGILDDAYLASADGAGEERDDDAARKRYWVHQSKFQEAKSGFDFGIVTPFVDGRLKVTLFQAKRPRSEGTWRELFLGQVVRAGKEPAFPVDREALHQELRDLNEKIATAKKEGRPIGVFAERRNELKSLQGRWDKHSAALAQKAAIAKIKGWIKIGTKPADIPRILGEDKEMWESALRCGPGSLFNKPYSYPQSDVFLATALRGWVHPGAETLPRGWCHYVQWVNQRDGAPWSVPLEWALATDGRAYRVSAPFAEILAAALSSYDDTTGLLLAHEDLDRFTGLVSDQLPSLVWGCVANRRDIAYDLLYACGVTQAEFSPALGDQVAPDLDDPDPDDGPAWAPPGLG